MTLQAIIFDLDGTLVDTMGICIQSLQETIAHYAGAPLPEAELYAHMGPTEEGMLHAILGDHGPAAYRHFLAIYERLHQAGADQKDASGEPGARASRIPPPAHSVSPTHSASQTHVFPGVIEMLEVLRARRLRLAIATGKGAETAAITLRCSGLAQYVERVETGFIDCGNKPRLIRRVLDGWGLAPAQTAYLGDALSDMHAAQQAGVLPLGAAWAAASPLRAPGLPEEWLIFRRVEQLMEWVTGF